MSQISVPVFLDYLRRSRLLDDDRLSTVLAEIESEIGPEQINHTNSLVAALLAKNAITLWQSHQLLKKRYKGFFLRQYKILSHLGAGGMSTVYLAEHNIMQRRVAIKVLPKKKLEKSVYLDRFIREAQTIASLDHPNIVRAYDIDQEDDVHYIVMEYFEGRNLQDVVDQDGPLSYEIAADYMRQAALALAYAHQAGVIHRDVKPANLLVNSTGLVKVLDLGLALLDERSFQGRLTSIQEDKILGTADYLAPEQGIDSHKVDARADLYGLGGVLYFCLTGHAPFPKGTIPQRLLAHQNEEPKSIIEERPDVPDDLVQVCRVMMAKKPENRQQSALEVVLDLQDWLILHGFGEESDFPPLETLRATNETLGAVPIPSQEERLKNLTDEQWLAEQGLANEQSILGEEVEMSSDPNSHSRDSDAASGSALTNGGASTVSGMMSPVSRRVASGRSSAGGSRSGSSQRVRASQSSASEISGLHPRAGIIVDDDDVLVASKKLSAEENDPVLFAIQEISQIENNTAPKHAMLSGTAGHDQTLQTQSLQKKQPNQSKQTIQSLETTQISRSQLVSSPAVVDWYKYVPVWFWVLFLGSIICTIFLAGVLVTLLVNFL